MTAQPYQFPWMDSYVETFRDQVRRYLAEHFTPHIPEWREQGYVPAEVWKGLGDIGALLPELPEQYGGSGTSLDYQLVLQDECGRAEMTANLGVHTIAAHYILDYGTEAQKDHWLPLLASGEVLSGIAMTEPGCGSDLKAVSTRARREGDEYVIDGTKIFITNGMTAGLIVLVCRTGDEGAKGLSLLLIDTRDLPGFKASALHKIGQHSSDTAELSFDGVRVPVSCLLGEEEGRGFAQLMSQLAYERLLLAIPGVAVMERALELTIEHAKQRKMFGGTLFDMQNTKFKLAELATVTHIARSFVNDCTQRLIDGTLDPDAAYMAKLWCTEQQCKVVDECLQLFGGYGYMDEYPIARFFVDARVQRIYGGANEVMKDLISRSL